MLKLIGPNGIPNPINFSFTSLKKLLPFVYYYRPTAAMNNNRIQQTNVFLLQMFWICSLRWQGSPFRCSGDDTGFSNFSSQVFFGRMSHWTTTNMILSTTLIFCVGLSAASTGRILKSRSFDIHFFYVFKCLQ